MEVTEVLNLLSGPYLYQILFILMIFCGLGSPLNADITLIFMGTLTGLGKVNPFETIIVAYFGLLIGDTIMFTLGRRLGFSLLKVWPLNKIIKKNKVYLVSKFIKRRGAFVILIARFIPGTRTITIFGSGVFKMAFLKYLSMNALGLAIMIPLLVFIGKLFISNILQAQDNLFYIPLIIVPIATLIYFVPKKIKARNLIYHSLENDR